MTTDNEASERFTKAFSLIEAAIVLGVVGLIIGGIWIAAAAVMENQRQAQTIEDILAITSNIRQRFPIEMPFYAVGSGSNTSVSQYDFYDTTAANHIRKNGWDGIIPPHMISSDTVPRDAWGGYVQPSVSAVWMGGKIEFYFFEVPRSTCASLGPKIAAALSNAGHLSVNNFGAPAANQSLMTPELASTSCSLGSYAQITVSFDR